MSTYKPAGKSRRKHTGKNPLYLVVKLKYFLHTPIFQCSSSITVAKAGKRGKYITATFIALGWNNKILQ